MQVQVHTDNHFTGREALVSQVEAEVEGTLGRFEDRLTRVEVFIGDENGPKHGADDKRCLMEGRLSGHPPVTATHHAATIDASVRGAAEKLERAIEHILQKHDVKGNPSMSGQ